MVKALTDPKLLTEVYKALISQDQFYTDLFEKRIVFFTGLITAVITGLGATLLTRPPDQVTYFILLIGGGVIVFIAQTGYSAAKRAAHRIKRNITEMAKVEQVLGLTVPINYKSSTNLYWSKEPIVTTEHLTARKSTLTSAEFVVNQMNESKENSFSRTAMLYKVAQLAGWIIIVLALSYLQRYPD